MKTQEKIDCFSLQSRIEMMSTEARLGWDTWLKEHETEDFFMMVLAAELFVEADPDHEFYQEWTKKRSNKCHKLIF